MKHWGIFRRYLLIFSVLGIFFFSGCMQAENPFVGTWKERTLGEGDLTLNADGTASWYYAVAVGRGTASIGTVHGRWTKIDDLHIKLSITLAGQSMDYNVPYDKNRNTLTFMGLEYYKSGAVSNIQTNDKRTTSTTSSTVTAATNEGSANAKNTPDKASEGNTEAASSEGPIMDLKFDEGKGGVVIDSSNYGNNGIVHNAKWLSGKFGSALQFNGVDSYVQIPDSPSLDLTGDMTIELWTMPGALQVEWADILSKHTTNIGGFALEQKYRETNEYTFAWSTNGVNWACGSITDSVSLTPNVWQHIAVSKSGSTVTYYLDGKEAAYCRGNFAGTSKNTLDLTIGKWSTGARYYNGIIDEVRIYNRALSAQEINAQYQSQADRYL